MNRFLASAERLVEFLMGLALTVMVVLIFGNVVLRYVFNTGIAWAEEIARLMFVWMIFLGAIIAMRKHAHIGVEMLQERLPRPARLACAIVSHLLMIYGLWLFASGSWTQTIIGLDTYSTVLGYPTALMAGAGLLCAVSMIVIVAVNLLRILSGHAQAYVAGESAAGDTEDSGAALRAKVQGVTE
jgi:TRAP-type transport system small permease protein